MLIVFIVPFTFCFSSRFIIFKYRYLLLDSCTLCTTFILDKSNTTHVGKMAGSN